MNYVMIAECGLTIVDSLFRISEFGLRIVPENVPEGDFKVMV